MAGIIGKKIGMTSVYSAEGKNLPCTLIEASPCVVTQIKTEETLQMHLKGILKRQARHQKEN